jgi:hypothetical protein
MYLEVPERDYIHLNKKIEVHQINVKAVTQLIKERIGVDSPDIKYYDVDDWVYLVEVAGTIITGLKVLTLRVENSNDEDRLETPEMPVEIPEMSVTRPKTPISRPSYKTIITMVTEHRFQWMG